MMFGIDWLAIVKIIGLDLLLGGDNAVLIALAVASLAPEVRNKAIAFGTFGAVAMRAIMLVIAGWLVGHEYIRLIAGLMLLYIGYKLLAADEEGEPNVKKSTNIWGAVWAITVADMLMSLDNVLAVIGAAQSTGPNAIYYSIAGIVISIPIIVFGSKLIGLLMDRFPIVIWAGGGLLGLVGIEMLLSDPYIQANTKSLSEYAIIGIKALGFFGVISTAWLATKGKE